MSAADRFLQETFRQSSLSKLNKTSTVPLDQYKFHPPSSTTRDPSKFILPGNLTRNQVESFILFSRLEEINTQLHDLYSSRKQKSNQRERLENERSAILERIMHLTPNQQGTRSNTLSHRTSSCTKHGSKWHETIWIPAADYPQINFVGLLIGPRGNTLKRMETDSGAKISIRGGGAEKEGKVRSDGTIAGGINEELHCLVMGDTEAKVKKAVELVQRVIERAASSPEAENEMKQNQLRELAILNGTLRDASDLVTCSNCGAVGHRKFECPERKNVTATLLCRICGGTGHTTSDCMHRNNPEMVQASKMNMMRVENDLLTFLSQMQ